MEKYILRKAFDTPDDPYLPADVLWRQKEQFSDGVGYSWIDGLKAHAEGQVTDQQLAAAVHRYAGKCLLFVFGVWCLCLWVVVSFVLCGEPAPSLKAHTK